MADEDKTTVSRPVEPVQVAVIATGDSRKLQDGIIAQTPDPHQPNLVTNVVQPVFAIAIRFTNTFLTVMLGLVMGSLATNVIPAHDFFELLWKCAGLSVAGAGIGLLKDLVTIFGKLEGKYPLLTGSV